MGSNTKSLVWLIIAFVVMELALIWALNIAPPDSQQGDVQRIFYFHLGSIWPSFLAFFYVLYASIRFLKSRDMVWDQRALVAGEVGLAFGSLVLITGPIWAKPTWGVWWAWDARLTSMLVLWLVFLGYVNLRKYIDDQSKRAPTSAVLGIFGACMVPFVYMSTRIYETQHPAPVIMGDKESGIADPNMQFALILALVAFTLLFGVLWGRGTEILAQEARVNRLTGYLNLLEDHP